MILELSVRNLFLTAFIFAVGTAKPAQAIHPGVGVAAGIITTGAGTMFLTLGTNHIGQNETATDEKETAKQAAAWTIIGIGCAVTLGSLAFAIQKRLASQVSPVQESDTPLLVLPIQSYDYRPLIEPPYRIKLPTVLRLKNPGNV